jgi:hypothetical protein
MAARVPDPAYPAKDSAVLYGDKELYARIGKVAEGKGGKDLVESFEIPIRSGKAWVVKKGRLVLLLDFFFFFFSIEIGDEKPRYDEILLNLKNHLLLDQQFQL